MMMSVSHQQSLRNPPRFRFRIAMKAFISAVLFFSSSCEAIKILTSTLELTEYGDAFISGAKLINSSLVPGIVDMTFCMRFNYKLLGEKEGKSRLITISDWQADPNVRAEWDLMRVGARYPYPFIAFGNPRKKGSYGSFLIRDPDRTDDGFEIWASNRWSSFCLSYTKSQGNLKVVKDGKEMMIDYPRDDLKHVVIPEDVLIDRVWLARCHFDWKGSCSGPGGQVTDFNMWKRALTTQEMMDYTTCKRMLKGDMINWDTSKWELENMSERETSDEEICVSPRPGNVLFPEKRTFADIRSFCPKVKGITSVIKGPEAQNKMIEEANKYDACFYDGAGYFWSGWWDFPQENVWTDSNTGQVLRKSDFSPWYLGEPNGYRLENCGTIYGFRNTWNDFNCHHKFCGFCELEKFPDIRIRGLCVGSKFDKDYSLTMDIINDRHSFRGFTDTLLSWDPESKGWKLELYSDPNIVAITSTTDYPFGSHEWTIDEPCYSDNSTKVTLSMNACENDEFNCVDGNCVHMNERCDGVTNCPDKSDEIDCEIITFDKSYLKEVPPPAIDSSTLPVNVSIDVLSIIDIAEVESRITLQFRMALTWMDTRLTMLNLKEDVNLNTLTEEFRNKIWIPEVIFYNTQSKLQSLNDANVFATVKRAGKYLTSPQWQVQNSFTFQGGENPITLSRVYDIDFICEFTMEVFPFDTQTCSIILIMKGNSGKFVHLNIDEMQYLGPIDLTQYFVKNTTSSYTQVEGNATAIEVQVIFGRRILGTILTTYLPTILLCIVSFSTNYFKAFFFEAIVTVNLTALLVLTTLFISVSNGLPKTSYIKMMEVWLIFNLFIPFAEVLLHTLIDQLREEYEREINHHGTSRQVSEGSNKADTRRQVGDGKVIEVREAFQENNTARKNRSAISPVTDLIHRDEFLEVKARQELYRSYKQSTLREKQLKIAEKVAVRGLPLIFFIFCTVYFTMGIIFYNS